MNLLKNKNVICGGWVQTGSSCITEVMADSGYFDWICIDLEHGIVAGFEALVNLIRVIELHHVMPVVRVPKNDHKWIGRSLDAGAKGIIVPMVNSVGEAQQAVDAMKYPPHGKRGFGYSRSNGFGRHFWTSIKKDDTALIVQIEHEQALRNLRGILNVEGVDGSLIGPLDLKGSVDINMDDTLFTKWVEEYLHVCEGLNKPAGIHIVEPDLLSVETAKSEGYRIIAVGTDAVFLRQRMDNVL